MSPDTRISSAALVSRPSPASWQQPRWTPPHTAAPQAHSHSPLHACPGATELDRAQMTASTTTMAKVQTVRVDPTSYTSRHPLPLPTFSPSTRGIHAPPLLAWNRGCVATVYRPNTTPPVPHLPLTAGATARLGFHRNISVTAAESCELRRHASRRRRRLEGGLRGRQVGRTGPMGSLVAARPAVALAAAAVAQPGMPPPPGAPPPPPPPGAPPSPSDMQQEEATPPCHATLLNSASNQKPAPPASAYQALSQEQRALLPGPFSLQERAKYEVGGSRAPVPAPVPVAPVATAAPCAPQLAAQAVPAPVGPPLPSAPQQQLAALAAPAVPTPVVPFVLVGGMLRPFIDQGEQPQAKRLRSVASDEASGGGAPHRCSSPGPSVDTPAALIEHSWTACSTSASRVLAAAHAHHTSVSGVLDASTSSGSVLERPKPATADSTLFYRAQLTDLVRFDGPSVQDGEEVHSALPAPTPQPKKVPSAWDGVSTPHACKHCKTSKVTCLDGMRPCARCVRLGYPCEETARPVKHACTNCSRAKIKCDRDAENDRCRRCQHLGLVCVPSQHNVSHQRRYEGPRRPMLPPGIFSRIAPATESTALAGAAGIAAGSTALVGPESTALLGAESTASLGTEATALAAARGTPQGTYQVAQPMPSTTRTGEQHEPWRKLSAYAFYALG